jgi:SHAQKYF class myb-like DNA-binding protein
MMTTAATGARNLAGTPAPAAGKKKRPRKPYTISRPREKWTADEHALFLHALLRFGHNWKTIERFVATKTATQTRSHAQKYFLEAHRLGLAAAVVLPQRGSMNFPAAGGPCWPRPGHDDGERRRGGGSAARRGRSLGRR